MRARATVLLLGSYDGSGNYGDVLQLEGAVRTCRSRVSDAPLVAVLELRYRESHRDLMGRHPDLFSGVDFVYFDTARGKRVDAERLEGLTPLDLPFPPFLAYLYGGGYLNEMWGLRKAAMLALIESLAQRPPGRDSAPTIFSGQQVSAAAVDGSLPPVRALLDRSDLIGVRDPVSLELIREGELQPPRAVFTGDDAAEIISGSAERSAESPGVPHAEGAALTLNVHLSAESYVTSDPRRLVGWVEQLLGELRRRAERPLEVNLVVAYDDRRISERPILQKLGRGVLSADGDASAEEMKVQTVDLLEELLERDLKRFRAAALTISCSYHVALTALLQGQLVLHLAENAYYRHKARGLQEQFGLPEELLVNIEETTADTIAERALNLLDGKDARDAPARRVERGGDELLEAQRSSRKDIAERIERWYDTALEDPWYAEALEERISLLARRWAEAAARLTQETERRKQAAAAALRSREQIGELRGQLDKTRSRLTEATERRKQAEAAARKATQESRRLRAEVEAMRTTRAWRLATRYRAARARLEVTGTTRLAASVARSLRYSRQSVSGDAPTRAREGKL